MQDIVKRAMTLTSFAQAVDQLLTAKHNTTLTDFITSRRTTGASFADIAEDLHQTTGIQVTRTTVANWTNDIEEVSA